MGTLALLYENDSEIIKEYINSKSDRAASAFVRKYQKFVYSTSLRYLNNYDDADDITQEVFIKALNSLDNFRGESNLKTWLYRITVNLCSNALKKRKLLNLITFNKDDDYFEISSSDETPSQSLETKEFETRFLKILNSLPEKQRETFYLRYYDDLSYEEISNLIGTSIGGLKANYFQAVQKIAKELKSEKS
ncbi:MAG: sigma-70 family RNA polymerase sigma factor [Candidatus Kapabacteria bacterium]|nr:sigma-70 family RNA polymerase sigma factor [Candidatus Kapabacteria bacterium]